MDSNLSECVPFIIEKLVLFADVWTVLLLILPAKQTRRRLARVD